jgi:hypothetical protein
VNKIAQEYTAVVGEWNARIWENRNKIRLLVSERYARAFLDYDDDQRLDAPQSIHYRMVKAGRIVQAVREGAINPSVAQQEVYSANHACSNFLEALTTDFLRRATSLRLLDSPRDDAAA